MYYFTFLTPQGTEDTEDKSQFNSIYYFFKNTIKY